MRHRCSRPALKARLSKPPLNLRLFSARAEASPADIQLTAIQSFTPPHSPPTVVERRLPRHAGAPLIVSSHGYGYKITGNSLLPAAALRRTIETAADPGTAVGALSALYRERGYLLVAVRAQVLGHHVTVTVVEGQITGVKARPGIAHFYRGVQFDPAVDNNALIRRNLLAEAYAARSGLGLKPSVAPAPQPGGTELAVDAPAQPGFKPVSGNVVLGNYGSRYVGGLVLGENLAIHPGHGLEFTLGYSHGLPNLQRASAGSRSDTFNAGASIVTPWGFYGLNYGHSGYRLGTAGAPYYPSGSTDTFGATGSQLFYASPTLRLSTTEGLTHVGYKSTVLGGAYTLADQDYNYGSVGLQLGRNVAPGGLPGAVNVALNVNVGLSGQRGTLVYDYPSAPQAHFHSWGVNANWVQSLPRGWSANLTANGQWGLDMLPANQQWVLGGYGSLAAWNPGVLTGDGGYLLRSVAQAPAFGWHGWQVSLLGFAEQGAVTNHYQAPGAAGWQMLADVGVGVTLISPWQTQLTLTAARPVASKNVSAGVRDSLKPIYVVLQQPF